MRLSAARRARAVLLTALLVLLPALGPTAVALERAGTARIVEIVDGDTVVLDDGSQVRLVGLQAPKLPLGRPNFPTWPLAAEAKAALEEIALGQRVSLSYGGTRMDRHGRRLAHLHVLDEDGAPRLWVQGEMLRRGMARVYTFPDNRAMVAEMLALEREARAARRGIWALDWYRILSPAEAARHIDSFQLVEGRVLQAAEVKGRIYLNFGEDWRTDFTVSIPRRAWRAFRAAGMDPLGLEGERIRVRGWLEPRNGPAIEATHPEQIERLGR